MTKIRFVDAFAGIGGFHYGIKSVFKDDAKCVAFIEWDKNATKTYEDNHNKDKTIKHFSDISLVKGDEIPDHELLCGGFPCQPFSVNKQNSKKATVDIDDQRSYYYKDLARIAKAKKPKYLLFENVANLATIKHEEGGLLIDDIVKTFENIGYEIEYGVLDAADFGVPQQRKRVYILGKRVGWKRIDDSGCDANSHFKLVLNKQNDLVIPKPKTSRVPLRSVLEEIYDEDLVEKFTNACTSRCALKSDYQGDWSDDGKFDWNWDRAGCYYCNKSNDDDTVYKWIKGKRGNANFILEATDIDKKDVVWQDKLHAFEQDIRERNEQSSSNKKTKKKTKLGIEPMSIIMYDTPSAISRQHERIYSVDGISRTLATFGHPIYYVDGEYRKLSSRESARCQGFPDEFVPHEKHSVACKQFGNAVCVEVIKSIVEHNFKEN
jgi:DNA-cytosine methyltransferase